MVLVVLKVKVVDGVVVIIYANGEVNCEDTDQDKEIYF